ncbi:armadillo-type protein [Baffinella frigidus]|nr:armadillo-type protein [Cryptophyta sp. CCMP2293]
MTEKIDSLPDLHLRYKVLPELLKAVEFGGGELFKAVEFDGGGTAAIAPMLKLGTAAIAPMLKLGQRMSAEDFGKEVVPGVVRCFGSQDRATRIGLLQNLHTFADHLSPALVEKEIFPKLASGFTDAAPVLKELSSKSLVYLVLRELSAKSLVYLVPKLSERVINSQVLRALSALLQDSEGSIRCNTTICLGKISPFLSAATREKVLLPSFTRAVNDTFPPARIAALMSLSVTLEFFSAPDIARRVLPSVAMLTIDPERQAWPSLQGSPRVRENALTCLHAAVKRLEEMSKKVEEDARTAGRRSIAVCVGTLNSDHLDAKWVDEDARTAGTNVVAAPTVEEDARTAGTNVVAAPTVTEGGVIGWAATAAASTLSKQMWGTMGAGMGGGASTPSAPPDAKAPGVRYR